MNNITYVERFWWWAYGNLFNGHVAMVLSCCLVFGAVYSFIRWRMFALSILLLTTAFFIAYGGGVLAIIRSF